MKRLVCIQWDESTQTCTVEAWADEPEPLFPSLTLAESSALATAIIGLWAFAYVLRVLIRQANQI